MEYNLHPPDGDYCLYIQPTLKTQSSHCSELEAGGGGAVGSSQNVVGCWFFSERRALMLSRRVVKGTPPDRFDPR